MHRSSFTSNMDPEPEPSVVSILSITQTGVTINTEAFNSVLDKVGDRRLAIISISGETRTGKSYLLNFFIRYFEALKERKKTNSTDSSDNWIDFDLTSSFKWRSGKERETTGMNLWSEPYFVRTQEGEVAVLLMDTQGLFDDQTTARQNAIIFSLTALCSSVIIYNVMRNINEELLQQIQYFSGYAHTISGDANSQSPSGEKKKFQELLILVRDFETTGYAHGMHERKMPPIGSWKNYMRDSFHLDSTPENCPTENTQVRKGILQNFENVSIFLLPDPGKTFLRGSSGPDDDFRGQLKSFVELMVSGANLVSKLKEVEGYRCTGTKLKGYVNRWARLVEKSEEMFPEVFTMAENTAFVQLTIAKDVAVTFFTRSMDKLLDLRHGTKLTPELLEEKLKEYSDEATRIYERVKKFKSERFDEDFQKQFEDAIKEYTRSSPKIYEIQKYFRANRPKKTKGKIKVKEPRNQPSYADNADVLPSDEFSGTQARNNDDNDNQQNRRSLNPQRNHQERKKDCCRIL